MFNQNHKIQIISKYNLYKTTNEFILSYVDLNRGGPPTLIDPHIPNNFQQWKPSSPPPLRALAIKNIINNQI